MNEHQIELDTLTKTRQVGHKKNDVIVMLSLYLLYINLPISQFCPISIVRITIIWHISHIVIINFPLINFPLDDDSVILGDHHHQILLLCPSLINIPHCTNLHLPSPPNPIISSVMPFRLFLKISKYVNTPTLTNQRVHPRYFQPHPIPLSHSHRSHIISLLIRLRITRRLPHPPLQPTNPHLPPPL